MSDLRVVQISDLHLSADKPKCLHHFAKVRDADECCKGIWFSNSMFNTNKNVDKNCAKAHKWADELIEICDRQEVGGIA